MERTNPFPGMNPYLESKWGDVHVKLIALIAMELGTDLPDGLVARGESHVSVTKGFDGDRADYWPDIKISAQEEDGWKSGFPPVWNGDEENEEIAVAVPKIITTEPPPERWIEIQDVDGRLVTVIEVLSPTNKSGGRRDYRNKRDDYIASGVNVVEIDLLRGGQFTVNLPPEIATADPAVTSTICVTRGFGHRRCEFYPVTLRDPLPIFRVPLRPNDPDVPLDLQTLVNRVYETGRYWLLDFSQLLSPKLSEEDAEWVEARLRKAGLAGS